jgi:hypothetical protein
LHSATYMEQSLLYLRWPRWVHSNEQLKYMYEVTAWLQFENQETSTPFCYCPCRPILAANETPLL